MRISKNPYRKWPEWLAWKNMLDRCNKPSPHDRSYIYDRGIKVHESWIGERGFVNFLQCVGRKPSGTILGRLDRDMDYSPGNVEWMSYSEFNYRRPTPFNTTKGYKLYVAGQS